MKSLLIALVMTASLAAHAQTPSPDDPYLWLEEVQGEKALNWVRERNRESRAALEKHPRFEPMRARFLEILDSKEKIPTVTRRGDFFYNLWQDAKNPRGLWRRTTLAEYRKPQPAWETVLDLDALGAAESASDISWANSERRRDSSRVSPRSRSTTTAPNGWPASSSGVTTECSTRSPIRTSSRTGVPSPGAATTRSNG